jgi:hypothetical protein
MVGGGGYNPEHTARGWALAWTIMCGKEPDNNMSIGMGGMFLGNAEWGAGLRDSHVYTQGDDRKLVQKAVAGSIDIIKRTVFPIHHI